MAREKKSKHHILPEVFLKKFTRQDGQMHRLKIDVPWGNAKAAFFTSAIGYKKDYYEIIDEDDNIFAQVSDNLYVENTVNQYFENSFNTFWPLLEASRSVLSIEEKTKLTEIIVHLRLRNQNIRNKVFSGQGISNLHNDFKNNARKDIQENSSFDPYRGLRQTEQIMEYFANTILNHRNGGNLHNRFLADTHLKKSSHREFVIQKHVQSHWTILLATEPNVFILGDNPGLIKNAPGHEALRGPFEFIFPINSSRCLYTYHDGDQALQNIPTELSYMQASETLVSQYNEQSVWDASEYIYGKCSSTLEKSKAQYIEAQKG